MLKLTSITDRKARHWSIGRGVQPGGNCNCKWTTIKPKTNTRNRHWSAGNTHTYIVYSAYNRSGDSLISYQTHTESKGEKRGRNPYHHLCHCFNRKRIKLEKIETNFTEEKQMETRARDPRMPGNCRWKAHDFMDICFSLVIMPPVVQDSQWMYEWDGASRVIGLHFYGFSNVSATRPTVRNFSKTIIKFWFFHRESQANGRAHPWPWTGGYVYQ